MYTYIHACMHEHMHAHTHTRKHVYVCMCACMHVCMHVCIHACMHMCVRKILLEEKAKGGHQIFNGNLWVQVVIVINLVLQNWPSWHISAGSLKF